MFMHIISIKYGPAAAGIIGVLYTGGVQTDGSFEVPVRLKWQGTTEEKKAAQLYKPKERLLVRSLKHLGTKS